MSKKEGYREVLTGLMDEFLKTDNQEAIREYLASNSNLPGPRGNLELAYAFADVAESYSAKHPKEMWAVATGLAKVSASEAPANNPKELVPFCGALAIGALGSTHEIFRQNAFAILKKLADDSRWRTREGVAMGIQRLIAKQGQKTLKELDNWVMKNEWLAMRAIAAGVAEPALLKNEEIAKGAFALHKKIFAQILDAGERKSAEFKTLRQALGYSLSVVVCAVPDEGFAYMRQIAKSHDADVLWVLRENLKKNRLVKNFPDEVAVVKKLVS